YRRYVERGGRLLLLADHMAHAPPDALGLAFGIDFQGITRGENVPLYLRLARGYRSPRAAGLWGWQRDRVVSRVGPHRRPALHLELPGSGQQWRPRPGGSAGSGCPGCDGVRDRP